MKLTFRFCSLPILFLGMATIPTLAQVTTRRLSLEEYQVLKASGAPIPVASPTGFMLDVPAGKPAKPAQGVLKGGGGASCDCWIQPDASYTLAMPPNDDGSSAAIAIPFSFNLYGDLYNVLYINNNGNISFDMPWFTYSSSPFPTSSFAMVAAFWADVDTRGPSCLGTPPAGEVWYKITPTAIYVNWVAVGYYGCQNDKLNTFQIILTDGTDPVIGIGKNVSLCYGDMQWTTGTASGGIGGFGGTPANVGANRGNGIDYIQFGLFDQAGTTYDGPFGLNDGVDWLDGKNFVITTSVFTSNIPPIGSSIYLCDTVDVCVGQQVTFDFVFLSPEPGQITTATSWATTLANYTEIVNTSGNTALITAQFTPLPAEVGFQQITFEGTDDGSPGLTATYNIVVQVFPAPATASGSITTCSNDPPVDLFALLAPPLAAGGSWLDPLGNAHGGTFVPGTDPGGGYNYAVGGGAGCPSTGTVTVTVVTAPDAGLDGSLATCTSNTPSDLFLLLGGTPDAGGAWTAPGGTSFINPLDPYTAAAGNYTYTVPGTAPCANDQSIVAVAIAQAVDAGVDATVPLCADAPPLDLLSSLGGTPDATGNWYTPGGTPFGGTFNASVDAPGIYLYVTPAVVPCEPDSSELTITVDPLPDAGADGSLVVCADDPNVMLFPLLGGTPDPGGTWIDPNNSMHSGDLDPSTELSGDYLYIAYGIGECSALTDTALIAAQLNHMPEVAFSVDPPAGCHALEVQFSNDTPPGQTGTAVWDFGDATGGNDVGTFTHTYANPGVYDVTLTITSPEGCVITVTEQDMVHVTPAPLATFTAYPNPAPVENPTVLFSATDALALQWEWIIEGLDTIGEPEFGFDFPNVLGDTYEVCLTVTDQWGCDDTQCQNVIIKDPLLVFVPNSFTPNGDGVNDRFNASIVGSDPEDYHLTVFDRWGGKVFDSSDLFEGWTGAFMNGGDDVLPTGVYAWRLITRLDDGGRKEYLGHVTLLK